MSRRPRYGPRWPQRTVNEWWQALHRLRAGVRHAAACVVFWDVLGNGQDHQALDLFRPFLDTSLRRYPSDAQLAAALVRVGYAPRYAIRRAKTPPDYKGYSRTKPSGKSIGARWNEKHNKSLLPKAQPWSSWGSAAV